MALWRALRAGPATVALAVLFGLGLLWLAGVGAPPSPAAAAVVVTAKNSNFAAAMLAPEQEPTLPRAVPAPPRAAPAPPRVAPLGPGADSTPVAASTERIHVAMATDGVHDEGLLALLHSIATNAAKPREVFVHIILTGASVFLADPEKRPAGRAYTPAAAGSAKENVAGLRQKLACHGFVAPSAPAALYAQRTMTLELVLFAETLVQDRIKVYTAVESVGNLASAANYARFFLPMLLPAVDKVIWLDCDTLLVADIAALWDSALPNNEPMSACPRKSPTYGVFFNSKVQALFKARYGRSMDPKGPTFNAGVFVANLAEWRRRDVLQEIFYWMVRRIRGLPRAFRSSRRSFRPTPTPNSQPPTPVGAEENPAVVVWHAAAAAADV